MVTQMQSPEKSQIIYPDDNGEPMSDNTEQSNYQQISIFFMIALANRLLK
jgi:hypothetical protein